MKKQRTAGAILIIVLGMMMVLSLLVTAFLQDLTKDLVVRYQLSGKEHSRHVACNALEVMRGNIEHLLNNGYGLPTKVVNPRMLNVPKGMQVVVDIQDESGKIPLNTTDQDALICLFLLFGDVLDAQALAKDLKQWFETTLQSEWLAISTKIETKTETVATKQEEKPAAADANQSQKEPAQGPATSKNHQVTFPKWICDYEQLKVLEHFGPMFFDKQGRPNAQLERLKQCTTLYSRYPVNINAVSRDGLKVLGKMFPSLNIDAMERHLALVDTSDKKHRYASLEAINTLGHGTLPLKKQASNGDSQANQTHATTGDSASNEDSAMRFTPEKMLTTVPTFIKLAIKVLEGETVFCVKAVLEVEWQEEKSDSKNNDAGMQVSESKRKGTFKTNMLAWEE